MKNFALVGASGFIASKHFNAIKQTRNNLLIIHDINDTVGKIDSFFEDSYFTLSFNEFKRMIKQYKYKLDYLVICLPNYLHYNFIKIGLENKLNVICEKPLVLKSSQLDKLKKLENKYKKKVNCIMQLRLDRSLIAQINKFKRSNDFLNVNVKYITTRGNWFLKSWKGDLKKSGSLTTNIGIHLFDFLIFSFGDIVKTKLIYNSSKTAKGVLFFKKAKVDWLISVDKKFLPKNSTLSSLRKMIIKNKTIDLSNKFTDLHTKSYINVLKNNGFGLEEVRKSLELCEKLRNEKK
jgi:UDP-N-acetyl-2-amino-2-deoxyglucuronate dehydrogenase